MNRECDFRANNATECTLCSRYDDVGRNAGRCVKRFVAKGVAVIGKKTLGSEEIASAFANLAK
jgi:hypothetical protein